MNETSHAIGKQHVNLQRFDQGRHFALSECRMHHGLSGAICTRLIVRCTGIDLASRSRRRSALEGTERSALRTRHSRDLAALRERSDNVPTLFAALNTKLLNAISDHKCRFLHGLFRGTLLLIHVNSLIAICNDK